MLSSQPGTFNVDDFLTNVTKKMKKGKLKLEYSVIDLNIDRCWLCSVCFRCFDIKRQVNMRRWCILFLSKVIEKLHLKLSYNATERNPSVNQSSTSENSLYFSRAIF